MGVKDGAMTNAWGMFCSCFEEAGDMERTDATGPRAGRILLPSSFRELPKSQKTYWNPLRTNGAYCYWRMLDAAGQDPWRMLLFCAEAYEDVERALAASEEYRTYFAAHRGDWQTRTQWWYEAVHSDEVNCRGGKAVRSSGGLLARSEELMLWRYEDDYSDRGPHGLATWCAKRMGLKKTRDGLAASRTYPEMLRALYAAPYNDGLRLMSMYTLLLKHLDWKRCEQCDVRVRDAYCARVPGFEGKLDRFKGEFFRIQREREDLARVRDASYGSVGEGPVPYFAFVARRLAALVEDAGSRERFLERLGRMIEGFVAQLHADRPFADHLSKDEAARADAFALGRYVEFVRQGDEHFGMEHLLYHVVKALAEGHVERIERLREVTRGSETRKDAPFVPCALYVAPTPVSDACAFPLDERTGQFVCGRKDEGEGESVARRSIPVGGDGRRLPQIYDDWRAWGLVYSHCFDISRRQFTLVYDAARQDWKLTVIGKSLFCRCHADVAETIARGGMRVGRLADSLGEGAASKPAECSPGVHDVLLEEGAWIEGDEGRWRNDGDWAYLKELAWFALPYREDEGADEERVRYVQVFTEYLG